MRPRTFLAIAIGLLATSCTAVNLAARSESSIQRSTPEAIEKRDTPEYIINPVDGHNTDVISRTETGIKAILNVPSLYSYKEADGSLRFWLVQATDPQLADIQKVEGVDSTEPNDDGSENHIVPRSTRVTRDFPNRVEKRDFVWNTQPPAPGVPVVKDLVMVSQPSTVPNLDDLENYVYERSSGTGIYIYHVERGITGSKDFEFKTGQVEFIQTPASAAAGQDPKEDGSDDGHSTCTASKAAGQRYGTAKKATLVVVRMKDILQAERTTVFGFVWQHIKDNGRAGKSIVTHSISSLGIVDPRYMGKSYQKMRDDIRTLINNDVVVVVAAGNEARQFRPDVDTAPAVFAEEDFPMVVVGAVDTNGVLARESQGGYKVKVLAPGVNIVCENKDAAKPGPRTDSGTSFATAMVAGALATFMSSGAFDMTPGSIPKNARDFLANTASWKRRSDNDKPVLWNLVDEANNPKKAPAPVSTSISVAPPPTSTEAPSPPPSPVVPPADPPSAPSCAPTPSAHYQDAHEGELTFVAKHFCAEHGGDAFDPNYNVAETLTTGNVVSGAGRYGGIIHEVLPYTGTNVKDDVYDISVTSVKDCMPNVPATVKNPIPGQDCATIMYDAWKNCNNQGRGGQITVGCSVYKVITKY